MKSKPIIKINDAGFYLIFLIIQTMFMTSCAAPRVYFTARKTDVPVLLSTVDRIQGPEGGSNKSDTRNTNNRIKIDLLNRELTISGEYGSIIKKGYTPIPFQLSNKVDATIARKILHSPPEANVYIDKLKTVANSWYFVFVDTSRVHVIMDGHVEEVLNLKKSPTKTTGE